MQTCHTVVVTPRPALRPSTSQAIGLSSGRTGSELADSRGTFVQAPKEVTRLCEDRPPLSPTLVHSGPGSILWRLGEPWAPSELSASGPRVCRDPRGPQTPASLPARSPLCPADTGRHLWTRVALSAGHSAAEAAVPTEGRELAGRHGRAVVTV